MKAVAIFHHISQLEDELIMLDPTANLGRPKEYREHLLERRKGRIEFEENFRKIGAPLTQIPPAADNEQKNRLLKFAPHSKKILTLLIDLNFLQKDMKLRIQRRPLAQFCQHADKNQIPTPDTDNWSQTWCRTLARAHPRVSEYPRSRR